MQGLPCQKAPSAKRCIKTALTGTIVTVYWLGQKAPSAKRCIKTVAGVALPTHAVEEDQKAPSAQNLARNSPSDHNRQMPDTAEYQQPEFKH